MDQQVMRTDADLGGAPEGLDALITAERLKAAGGWPCSSRGIISGRAPSFRRFSSSRKILKCWSIRRGDCLLMIG